MGKSVREITEIEYNDILSEFKTYQGSPEHSKLGKYYFLLRLIAESGLKLKTVCGLKYSDFKEELSGNKTRYYVEEYLPKSNSWKKHYIEDDLYPLLIKIKVRYKFSALCDALYSNPSYDPLELLVASILIDSNITEDSSPDEKNFVLEIAKGAFEIIDKRKSTISEYLFPGNSEDRPIDEYSVQKIIKKVINSMETIEDKNVNTSSFYKYYQKHHQI